jgi:hypothetical protein
MKTPPTWFVFHMLMNMEGPLVAFRALKYANCSYFGGQAGCGPIELSTRVICFSSTMSFSPKNFLLSVHTSGDQLFVTSTARWPASRWVINAIDFSASLHSRASFGKRQTKMNRFEVRDTIVSDERHLLMKSFPITGRYL